MDYRYHHDRLVSRARERVLDGYFERHHIIPKCMGGTDDPENIIELLPEEHYIIHLLLTKMYPETNGLIYAAHLLMTAGQKKGFWNNKQFAWVSEVPRSEEHRRKIGLSKIGKQYSLGLIRSDETRKKLSEAKLGKPLYKSRGRKLTGEQRDNMRKPKSEAHRLAIMEARNRPETKKKQSDSLRGRAFSDEHRENISKAMAGKPSHRKGIPMSEESKKKLSETKYKIAKEVMEWALFQ